jgi:HEPN domain-containing protein
VKSKEEHIRFWINQAEDDWQAVGTLFRGRNFLQSLFFAHLVIEKLCKSLWIKYNPENVPPRTHNLIYLLSLTPVELSEAQSEFLLNLNRFQLEGRYPEYVDNIYHICDEEFTQNMLNTVNDFREWLLKMLQ